MYMFARRSNISALLIAILVFIVYAQTHSYEFLRFDDHDYTFLCPFVRDGLSWANVKAAFATFTHAAIWMPITYISYMFDISLFGPGMGAHHLVNAAIHAANGALFCLLLEKMFGRRVFTFLAAAFWALHPMRVEPVAWIAGRKELLCAFWTLLGLLTVAKRGKCGVFTFLCCLAACMSKPTGMSFPFLALCVGAIMRRREAAAAVAWNRMQARSIVFAVHCLFAAAATGAIAVYSQTHAKGYDVRELFTAPFTVRALNALKSLGLYTFKTFIPFDLHMDCRWPTPTLPTDGWGTILAAVAGLCLLACWAMHRNGRGGSPRLGGDAILSLLFFLFAIAPTLGVFGSFGRETRADRFAYIPSMAISMVLLSIAERFFAADGDRGQSMPIAGKRLSVIGVLFVANLVYALLSLRLIPSFRNDYTAFSRVLACDPIHPRALSHVASEECARLKDFDSGIRHFRDSLACEWNRSTACQLAFALAVRGRREDVADIRALGESTGIAKNPETDRNGLMCEALGMAALKERRWLDAVPLFAAAVRAPARLNPPDDAYARLGVALANGGRRKEAEDVFSSLARPGAARESVRAFAVRSLEQLASPQGGRIMLFY